MNRVLRVLVFLFYSFIQAQRSCGYGDYDRYQRNAQGCTNPKALGMENGEILSSQIKASSTWSSFHRAALSRLNSEAGFGRSGAWSAGYSNRNQWLQVDFKEQTTITGISTQGRQDMRQWVKQYVIWYSNDGVKFHPYRRKNGWVKLFQGNNDRNSVVRHDLTTPIVTRYIRVQPVSWHGFISMRVEFYGCRKIIHVSRAPRCINPTALGMEKGEILSNQLRASSTWSFFHRAALGRLNSEAGFGRSGAWSAGYSNRNQWLQVDFKEQTTITGISTQGRQDMRQWVKQYIIWYSNNGVRFYPYRRKNGWVKIFRANTDQNSVVRQDFFTPIVARFVRVHPVSWHGFISMRVEFYGCRKARKAPGCINPKALGMEKGEILSSQIKASSRWSSFHRAALSRLNSEAGFGRSGAWSAGYSNRNQWLQVDFIEQTTITGISTQGRQDMRQWVKQYIIWYSNDGVRFYPYRRKNGWVKIFQGNTDQNSVVRYDFTTPIVSRYVRVRPVSWHGFISMRVEFYGCRKGILTTSTPRTTLATTQTPLVPKWTNWPKTTTHTPALTFTTSPTRAALITPPLPPTDSLLPPPVPPTIKTTKPPPPPSNKDVKCGTKGRVGRVVNGTESAAGSWPWQVGIKTCPDCNITCGGTLIKSEWVATAAHCVSDWFPEELYLVAGEIDQAVRSGHEQEFRCDKIIVHEQYGRAAPYDKDIALVRLSKYAVFNDHVRPLCLPKTNSVLTDKDLCTVTGFGRVKQSGLKSALLLQANVIVVNHDTCKKAYASLDPPRPVTKNMFCAGFEQGGTDACQGDSGGPLTCFDRRNAKFMLGGVVSWGVGCAQAKQYGVYTNVASFTSWIQKEMAKH